MVLSIYFYIIHSTKKQLNMKTNRLSKTIAMALNEQITKEAHASQIYLSYAAWADNNGYGGIANFLFRHATEERDHMMKLLKYLLNRGAKAIVTAIPAPASDPTSVNNCFEKVFAHEIDNTKSIYKIVKIALEEEDWATWNFLQWFVKEQIEEENLASLLLDKIKIIGGEKANGEGLYQLDKDLEKNSGEQDLAQEATTTNP
jgi:ferritin